MDFGDRVAEAKTVLVASGYEFHRAVPRITEVIHSAPDLVNHPPHYKDGGIEVIDYIEAKKLNYNLGNAVKYLSRAGKKDLNTRIQDLEKAIWYIKREIQNGKLT